MLVHLFIWGTVALVLFAGMLFVLTFYAAFPPLPALLLAANITSFVVYGLDKRAGEREQRSRAPVVLLLFLAFMGGSVGALAGVYVWNHKTSQEFAWLRGALFVILLGQVALALLWAYSNPG